MLTKKQFMIVSCLFLFAVVAYQTQPAEALPFQNEYNDLYLGPGEYERRWAYLDTGEVISGYFETDEDTKGIDFFIVDVYDYNLWSNGTSVSTYATNLNMHTLGFEFTIPYDDLWCLVFSNVPGTENVWVDIGIDIDGDETPFFSTADYDHTGYGEVLESYTHDYLMLYLAQGTVVDGDFATFFQTDGLDFFICDEENYNDWDSGYTATVYSNEVQMHTAVIDTFTIPTSGNWYFVFENQGQTDTVTYSYGISLDTTNAVVGPSIGWISIIGVVAAFLIILILCCVCRSKKKDPGPPPTQPTTDHYVAPPSTPTPRPTETVREREIVRDRVLVICPYCGTKNEQGITTCQNCDADL